SERTRACDAAGEASGHGSLPARSCDLLFEKGDSCFQPLRSAPCAGAGMVLSAMRPSMQHARRFRRLGLVAGGVGDLLGRLLDGGLGGKCPLSALQILELKVEKT